MRLLKLLFCVLCLWSCAVCSGASFLPIEPLKPKHKKPHMPKEQVAAWQKEMSDNSISVWAPLRNDIPLTKQELETFDRSGACPSCMDKSRSCRVCSGSGVRNPVLRLEQDIERGMTLKDLVFSAIRGDVNLDCPLCSIKPNPTCIMCHGTKKCLRYYIESCLPFLELKNRKANRIVAPSNEGEPPEAPENLQFTTIEMCPACNGAGKLQLKEPKAGQRNQRLGSGMTKIVECPLCKGQRAFAPYVSVELLGNIMARDVLAYRTSHIRAGEASAGGAFVPKDVFDSMDKRTRKMIEAIYGAPCRKCNWIGLEVCKKCKGDGVLVCTNRDCEDGWVVSEKKIREHHDLPIGNNAGFRSTSRNRSKTRSDVSVSLCEVCGGAKFVLCPNCHGKRAITCNQCHGTGSAKKAGKW